MPIYEYRCPDCGHEFEELVRNGREKVICPKCSQKKCKKLMSAAAFRSASGGGSASSGTGGRSGCGSCAATSCATCGK